MAASKESFMFTVGKLDAGMAILLGERAHLIEFPSILLPPGATAGSIVNISVQQNHAEESKRDAEFWDLQGQILDAFGRETPEPPKLELRNVTQTSVTLEWPPLQLATAKLRSLDIHRNGQRLATIPAPLQNTSTKLSGLDLDHEYTFQLFLRTTAGVFPSNLISVRTHTMQNTSGISVCFGNVQDPVLLERAKLALDEMGARWSDSIQIDTTHFVCTTPAATPRGAQATGNASTAPGVEYQRALQLSIPVVQPHWILACHAERKMVPISSYYLGATPASPMNAPPFTRPQSLSQVSLPKSPTTRTPTGAEAGVPAGKGNRASMPPMSRGNTERSGATTPMSPETQARSMPTFSEAAEAEEAEEGSPTIPTTAKPAPKSPSAQGEPRSPPAASEGELADDDERIPFDVKKRIRKGTMDKNFRFPPTSPTPPTEPVPPLPTAAKPPAAPEIKVEDTEAAAKEEPAVPLVSSASEPHIVAPSSIEVPPPPPVEKERRMSVGEDDDDVGATEEIPL